MKAFSINTLGCKVNQYESQQIRELLEESGLALVESTDKSDLAIINTCCVTHTASSKSRQYIRKVKKINSDTIIVICGCLPTIQTDELDTLNVNNVHIIRHRETLAATLKKIVSNSTTTSDTKNSGIHQSTNIKAKNGTKIKDKLVNEVKLGQITSFDGHTRAFIKVQDGCDRYCSYCIVPKVRPCVESKSIEAVLEEAQRLVNAGHKEIVITGIYLGAFGQGSARREKWANERNEKLAELVGKVAEVPGLARVRLSSLGPGDVTEGLLDVFCGHRNIMPHLHLSLQSGSNKILKRMCRPYTAEEFGEKVELIKARLGRSAITTDIIVGFPGESDADFGKTFDFARKMGFSRMHIFGFSARKGTAADKFGERIENKVIKKRSKIMRELGGELGRQFRQMFVGEEVTVLTENSNGRCCGRSERYFMVEIKGGKYEKNELVRVRLVENGQDGVVGQAV